MHPGKLREFCKLELVYTLTGCIPTWKTGKNHGISKVREKPGKVREFSWFS
jgi:hypothetical protein